MEYKIALIPGDGIGPEIVREARKVLDAVCSKYGHKFIYSEVLLGGASIDAHGVPLTEETIKKAKGCRCRFDGFYRRRRKDFPLVSAGAVQETGGRPSGYPKGAEPVC